MKTKAPARNRPSIVGRSNFAKISAVEGIHVSRRVEQEFEAFDKQGLSAAERRHRLVRKYGSKS